MHVIYIEYIFVQKCLLYKPFQADSVWKERVTMTYLFSAGFFTLLWVQRLVCVTACYMQILHCFSCAQSEPRMEGLCCSARSARKVKLRRITFKSGALFLEFTVQKGFVEMIYKGISMSFRPNNESCTLKRLTRGYIQTKFHKKSKSSVF